MIVIIKVVVFHAAANKHVPVIGENPWQAVKNNILGAQCVMEQPIEHKVGYFVQVQAEEPGL
jgi:FlaA1/EpsC-like NDP-sugar epimerase